MRSNKTNANNVVIRKASMKFLVKRGH